MTEIDANTSGRSEKDGYRATAAPNGSANAVPPDRDEGAQNAIRRSVEEVGSLGKFCAQLIRELPTVVRLYPSEIIRHAGLLIRANAAVVLFMMATLGSLLGLVVHFLLIDIGLDSYVGGTHSIGAMRGVMEIIFGWILAAKVGCGIVAELGAMRISEEVDAMEVMGIRSRAYLAGTRFLAAAIVVPFLWAVSLAVYFTSAYVMHVYFLETASSGAFVYFAFLFQNSQDFLLVLLWAAVLGLIIILFACYYGYTASGGPVGVGRNTARSMLVNLMMISIVAMAFVQLFYGNNPNAPIGN